jgi:hypothetical protein
MNSAGIGGGARLEVKIPSPDERCGDGAYRVGGGGLLLRSTVSMEITESFLRVEVDLHLLCRRPPGVSGLGRTGDAFRDGAGVANGSVGASYPCLSRCASKGRLTTARIPNRVHEAMLMMLSAKVSVQRANTYNEIIAKAIPKRAIRHRFPTSHAWSSGASDRHVGRRATIIMFQPEVRSQRAHSEIAKRIATYDVLLIAGAFLRSSAHFFCLRQTIVCR